MRSQKQHSKHRKFEGPEKRNGLRALPIAFILICLGLAAVWPGALFHVLGNDQPGPFLIKISAILIAALFIPVLLLTKLPALTGRIPGRQIVIGVFLTFIVAILAGTVSPQIRAFQEQAFVPTFTPYLAKLKTILQESETVQVSRTPPKAEKKAATKKTPDQQAAELHQLLVDLPHRSKRRYESHLGKGDLHLTGYRFEQAIAEYDQAIQTYDNNSLAKSKRDEAIRRKLAFDESKVKTKRYFHHLAIGDAFLEKKQYDQAIAAYEKAREISPTGIKAITNRAKAVSLKSQYGMALDKSNMAIDINPNESKGYLSRGQMHMGHGRYDQATADFDRAIQLNPKDSEAYESRAHSLFKTGHYDQAIADFSKAIELESSPFR